MAEVQSGEAGGVAGACASAGYGVCVRVWCGAYCILLHVISHTNTRAATNGGTAADGIATLARGIMDVNGHEALWTAWLWRALSVCTYPMYLGFCVNSSRVSMGKCRGGLRPLAGVANADGPGWACLLSCPCSDTLCVSRRRSELPLRQCVFVGRAGNNCVKQIDDVHVGGSRGGMRWLLD
jgi:hypothetical protein